VVIGRWGGAESPFRGVIGVECNFACGLCGGGGRCDLFPVRFISRQ
jgi:hypothetical protein